MRFLTLILIFGVLTACGTLPYKEFDVVKKGMDKSDVTEQIGSPLFVYANKQPHIWIYRFYDEDKKELFREIQFEKGKVVYAGPQVTKEKILLPNGSSYTQKDLEEYLKDPKTHPKDGNGKISEKEFQDQATMEAETLRDLTPKNNFKEIKPAAGQ